MTKLDEIREVLDDYTKTMITWIKENNLTLLPAYNKLKDKTTFGKHYRDDQNYYEEVMNFKANLLAIRSFITKERSLQPPRQAPLYDSIISNVNDYIRYIDTYADVAKQRIKFYETINYVISNMSYGDF